MSLQVCHCGWSKVTTYQGLRTHQGKMGCTARGVRVEESEQQYMWGNVGFTNNLKDFRLEAYAFIKTDTADDYSDKSLQVCHFCGWSKVTTYRGLRIHQGKMGCTPKGMRIPKRELYDWKNQWEEVDQRKHQPAKMTVKKETAPSPPSTKVRTNSVAKTATIKEECNSYFPTSQHSFQTATKSKSRRQPQDFSTGVQVNRSVRERPTPTYPVTAVRAKEKVRKGQTLSQIADSRVMTGNWSINRRTDSATTAATIKEEPKSPLAIPQRSSQTATNSRSGRRPQDFSTGVQVSRSSRERPTSPPLATAVQPKAKDRKDQTLSQARQERVQSELQRKIQIKEEKMSEITSAERACETAPSPPSTKVRTNSAAKTATIKEECNSYAPTSQHSFQTATNSKSDRQPQDFSPGVQVNRSVRERPTIPPRPTVIQPQEKDRKDQTLSQVNSLVREHSTATYPETVVRPKEKHREHPTLSQVNRSSRERPTSPLLATAIQPKAKDRKDQTLSQSVPDSTSTNTQTNSAAAEATIKEDPKSLCESAQPDFSTGMKVKELARIFSGTTTQETAVGPTGKYKEEQKLSQAKHLAQKLSATTAQETAVQPKEKDREVQKLPQNVPNSSSAAAQMNPASAEATIEEGPKSSCETEQLSDSSTGLKVKELAWMFSATAAQETAVRPKWKHTEEQKLSQVKHLAQKLSATTAQETAVQPKENHREVQNLPQSVPNSTSAAAQMNPASAEAACETAQLSDFSTGLKVKELARMFSATQETAVRPNRKHREERKISQWM